MSSAPGTRGRIRDFVRWVARTPWPLFSLGLLQADIIGALLVILIVAGVVRTRRRLTRSTSADDDAPGVEKVSG